MLLCTVTLYLIIGRNYIEGLGCLGFPQLGLQFYLGFIKTVLVLEREAGQQCSGAAGCVSGGYLGAIMGKKWSNF